MHKDNALTATKRISQNHITIMKTFSRFTEDNRQEYLKLARVWPEEYCGSGIAINCPEDRKYKMLREILNNSGEGFQRGYWKKEIVLNLSEEGLVSIRDYGTGIPQKYAERLVCGRPEYGRFCPGIFDEPEYEHLPGLQYVNVHSSMMRVTSYQLGRSLTLDFKDGVLVGKDVRATDEQNGTLVEFIPNAKYGTFDKERVDDIIDEYLSSGVHFHRIQLSH